MKKELKRYLLVDECEVLKRVCCNINEYNELLKKIDLYNKNSKNKYIFGNVSYFYHDGLFYVNIIKYRKLTNKMTISDIDELTSKMSEEQLINYFMNSLTSKPYINIAYFNDKPKKDKTSSDYDKRISLLPVLYRNSVHVLSKGYVMQILKYYIYGGKYDILYNLISKFESYKIIGEDIEKLLYELNKEVKDNDRIFAIVFNLYDNLVYERDRNGSLVRDNKNNIQKSRRRARDFGFFVEDYTSQKEEEFVSEDEIDNDRLQEEYSYFKWDQDNGLFHKNFFVSYDEQRLKFVRKF